MSRKLEIEFSIQEIEPNEKEMLVKRTSHASEKYRTMANAIVQAKNPEKMKLEFGHSVSLIQGRNIVTELKRELPDSFEFRPVAREKNDGSVFIGFLKKSDKNND